MACDISRIRYISLIRTEGGESILSIPYAELTLDPDLIAGFVTAVIIFAKAPIRTIRKAAYDILIEVGEYVLALLVVDPVADETPYRERLLKIIQEVELKHGEALKNFEGDIRRFREFALNVIVHFPFQVCDVNLIPYRRPGGGTAIPFRMGSVDKKLEKVESFINGKRSVADILGLIDLPDNETKALLSILAHYGWIDFKKRLDENVVLVRGNGSCDALRIQYGAPFDGLISAFNGEKTIKEVISGLPYDKDAIWFLINKMVEADCLRPKPVD